MVVCWTIQSLGSLFKNWKCGLCWTFIWAILPFVWGLAWCFWKLESPRGWSGDSCVSCESVYASHPTPVPWKYILILHIFVFGNNSSKNGWQGILVRGGIPPAWLECPISLIPSFCSRACCSPERPSRKNTGAFSGHWLLIIHLHWCSCWE